MNNNTARFRLHAGTASILLVFVTLCLVSFAVLTLVNANADLRLSEKIAERTDAYYDAVNQGMRFIAETDEALSALAKESASEADYLSRVRETYGSTVLQISYPLSEVQSLRVTLVPRYPGSAGEPATGEKNTVPDENRYGGNPVCLSVAEFAVITDESAYAIEEAPLNLPH